MFSLVCTFANYVFLCSRVFFHFLSKIVKISKKSKFPKMSDSVPSVFDVFPKMSEKSSRVPEWYTSGSWANAFDNTGWQKSPEYALIRIAAGAPDLAKSPNPPPDGPGRPRKSRHFSLRTEKLPDSAPGLAFAPQAEILSGAVFPDARTTRPSRQTDSEARRVLRQSPTHSANVRTLRKTLAEIPRQGSGHSAHCAHRAQPKPTHVHKLCTPETQTCTPCTTETQPCTLCAHPKQDVHTLCTTDNPYRQKKGKDTSSRKRISTTYAWIPKKEDGIHAVKSAPERQRGLPKGNFFNEESTQKFRWGAFRNLTKDEKLSVLCSQKDAQICSLFLYIYSLERALFEWL